MQSVNQQVRPPGSDDRRQATWIVVVAALVVAIALLKPWGNPQSTPGSEAPFPQAQATPEVTPEGSPAENAEVAAFCLDPAGWRIYSTQRWGGRDVRSWTALTPVAGPRSPLDPAIPVTPIVSSIVRTLGYCAPVAGPDRPPAWAAVSIFRLIRARTGRVDSVDDLHPTLLRPVDVGSALGGEYAPPAGRARGERSDGWPAGSYVFHVFDPTDGSYERWFGVEIELVESPRPSATD
jgi:hypothetical protein